MDRPAEPPASRAAAARVEARELIALGGILVLAALLRFIDLPTRGMWDADQGHDMLVLRAFVHDGVIPLLGPPTSIGTFPSATVPTPSAAATLRAAGRSARR